MLSSKSRSRGLLKNITVAFFSLLVCLLVAEFTVKAISPANVFHPALTLKPKVKMHLDCRISGVAKEGIFSTNKLGLRGDEPPKNWKDYQTIITIGGSTTQCFYLDDKKTWSYLLQEELGKNYPKVWVGNGGLDGHSTRGHLIFMRHVISKIRPKVAIFLLGVNDLSLSLDDGRRLYGSFMEKANWKRWLFAHSRLLQVLYIYKGVIFNDFFVVRTNNAEGFRPRPLKSGSIELPSDLMQILPSLGEYRRNIEEIINMGRSYGVITVFLTQPMLFNDTPYWRGVEGNLYWIKKDKRILSAAAYWKMMDIFNKELMDVCRSRGVLVYDLASAIGHSQAYFYDAVHFNEAGSGLVAQKVADFIRSQGILKE